VKAKEEHKYEKFLEMLKKFHINILFLEAIIDMPSYAKFLKDLLSNKGNLLENAAVSLTKECRDTAMLLFRTSSLLNFLILTVSQSLAQLGMLPSAGLYVILGLV